MKRYIFLSIIVMFFSCNSKEKELQEKINDLENQNKKLSEENKALQEKISEQENVKIEVPNYSNEQRRPISDSQLTATVVFKAENCDYFILENNSGFIVAEWMGGYDPSVGEVLTGNFHSFGTDDFYGQNRESRLWIDDYLLSKESAIEKLREQCN